MEDQEVEMERAGKNLLWSKIGRRRVMTTFAVGEAWEKFCTTKRATTIRSFRAVGLSLPINGSCDEEISIKGI